MNAQTFTAPRLTSLSHGGGCGCKIAPRVLAELLQGSSKTGAFPELLVGRETSDDAAVYRLNDAQAIVSTTDFFMPIVDDGFDFGQIAATNALSDIYAMGARPLMALAIVGMPINTLPHDVIREILRGGESVCTRAGIPVAGGHSIDSVEPIYGLAVTGVVHPSQVKRNSGARPGDLLVLGKPLGVGLFSAAFKKNILTSEAYRALLACTTQLNTPGVDFAQMPGVHAITDVTGFGLLGHLLEMCRSSGLGAHIQTTAIPLLPGALELARSGIATGASARNWQSYGSEVNLPADLIHPYQALLTDPQTSGGLLVACAREVIGQVQDIFSDHGFAAATIIGEFTHESGRVIVS
jgi:selenide, water dikinase